MRAVFVLVLNLLSAFSAAAQTIATLSLWSIRPSWKGGDFVLAETLPGRMRVKSG